MYSFSGALSDGRYPVADLTKISGTFYGTTLSGGTSDSGTVFKMSLNGANEEIVHSFEGGSDGSAPKAGLIVVKDRLYGTTYGGGAGCRGTGCGTIFRLTLSGTERSLHAFGNKYENDGLFPAASLTNVRGTLYGTTYQGGISLPSCEIGSWL